MATPGHAPSCLSYKIVGFKGLQEVSEGCKGILFTGDAYIPGVKVFTKFPRGNKEQALASIDKLSQMEKDGYIIHCGHHDYDEFIK